MVSLDISPGTPIFLKEHLVGRSLLLVDLTKGDEVGTMFQGTPVDSSCYPTPPL